MLKFMDTEPIPESWKTGYAKAIHPLIQLLTRWNMHPNTFTTLGFVISCISTYFMAVGMFRIASLLVLFAGVFDTIDGKLARDSGKVSRFGALYDSTLDRYSEVFLFFGMAYYFIEHDMYLSSVAVAVALGGSLMVSYIRARAEGLGFECKVGILQRPERLILIALGGLINVILSFGGRIHIHTLVLAVWIIAILSNVTAVVRMVHVWREDQGTRLSSSK
jgi:CDP-diacylglycerol---glycerol-3-phosphate 3-phosphatidyltransferase